MATGAIYTVLILCLLLKGTSQTITAGNQAVLKDATSVTMSCTFAGVTAVTDRKWYKSSIDAANELPNGASIPAEIKDTFSVTAGSGTEATTLEISSPLPDHADKYFCQGDESRLRTVASQSAHLEVLTPECNVIEDSSSPPKFEFTCSATYAKAWVPVLAVSPPLDGVSAPSETDKKVTITGTKPVADVNVNSEWTCAATFTASALTAPNDVDASNDVTNLEICKLQMAAPTKPTVSGLDATASVGDEITCGGSTAVPTPTYSWREGSTTLTGSVNGKLILVEDMSGKTLTCVAKNAFDENTTDVSVPNLSSSTDGTSDAPSVTEQTAAPVTDGTRGVGSTLLAPALVLVTSWLF